MGEKWDLFPCPASFGFQWDLPFQRDLIIVIIVNIFCRLTIGQTLRCALRSRIQGSCLPHLPEARRQVWPWALQSCTEMRLQMRSRPQYPFWLWPGSRSSRGFPGRLGRGTGARHGNCMPVTAVGSSLNPWAAWFGNLTSGFRSESREIPDTPYEVSVLFPPKYIFLFITQNPASCVSPKLHTVKIASWNSLCHTSRPTSHLRCGMSACWGVTFCVRQGFKYQITLSRVLARTERTSQTPTLWGTAQPSLSSVCTNWLVNDRA